MSVFFRYTLAYFLLATAVNLLVRGEFYTASVRAIFRSRSFVDVAGRGIVVFLLLFAIAYFTSPSVRDFLLRLRNAAVGTVLCCIFLGAFSTVKTAMPLIVEHLGQVQFFADPFFAEFDRLLHFGVDPWRFAHGVTHGFGLDNFANHASLFYGLVWCIPAFYLPAILLLLGEDRRTVVHFVTLYVFAWVILGNVVALIGSSAGPVYYDRLFLTDRFADLHPSMMAAGLKDSFFGLVQDQLWTAYQEKMQTVGSGISAFPSLHLATATILAVYLSSKGRLFGAIGWTFVAVILFISVWNGYHYAIDGYFSIAVMWGLDRYLRLRWSDHAGTVATEVDDVDLPVAVPVTSPAE